MSTQGRARVLGRVMTYNGTTAWLRQQGGNGRDIIAYEGDLPGAIRAGNLEGRVAEIRDLPNEIKAVATQLSLVPPPPRADDAHRAGWIYFRHGLRDRSVGRNQCRYWG